MVGIAHNFTALQTPNVSQASLLQTAGAQQASCMHVAFPFSYSGIDTP